MKKTPTKKLSFRTQTIRVLSSSELTGVVGGVLQQDPQGFIMQDTVIIPTGRR